MKNLKTFEEFDPGEDLDMIDESWFKKDLTPEEKQKKGADIVKSHPMKTKAYIKFKKEEKNDDKASKYLEFWVDHPKGQPVWSKENGENTWIDKSIKTARSHIFGSGS